MVIQGSPQTGAKDRTGSLSSLVVSVYDSVTSLHFCEKDIKTAVQNDQQDSLTNIVEPLNQTML